MQSIIEVEYKVLINKEEFNHLLHLYPNYHLILQKNDYYDTTPSLKTRGIGCRIREIDGNHYFTLKIKEQRGNEEIEFKIESDDLAQSSIQDVLQRYQISNLEKKGFLLTKRHLIDLEHAELCIDYNEYNGIEDYEVEYELKDPAIDTKNEFLSILSNANIMYVPNRKSKMHRCLETRRKM